MILVFIGCSYSSQLTKVLTSDDSWKRTIKSWSFLEEDIVFNKSGPSFTYLLLDPRISKNLPARADKFKNPIETWQIFVSSIFYIGKGSRSRPNDHMNEAFNFWIEKNKKEKSRKVCSIIYKFFDKYNSKSYFIIVDRIYLEYMEGQFGSGLCTSIPSFDNERSTYSRGSHD